MVYDWPNSMMMWDPDSLPERFQYSDLARAIAFATHWHDSQMDKSGHPAIFHPLAVAAKVAEAGGDEDQQVAAVLHDTIEDTLCREADIYRYFNMRVGSLVSSLTQMRIATGHEIDERYRDYIMRVWASGDEAVLIKRCDLEHNIERSYFMRPGDLRTPTGGWVRREFAGLVKRHREALELLRTPRPEPGDE